jgi:hypothetical protein
MQLQQAVNSVFVQLSGTLDQLSQEQYVQPCQTLLNATVGQHVRHIIELFQCLENGYGPGLVNYEKRKRDAMIESDKEFASSLLSEVHGGLDRPNKALRLEACYDENSESPITIDTNFYREVAYNLEHTIHHMALIRVGINEIAEITLPDEFGVATSTIKYRKECAQ